MLKHYPVLADIKTRKKTRSHTLPVIIYCTISQPSAFYSHKAISPASFIALSECRKKYSDVTGSKPGQVRPEEFWALTLE